MIRPALTAIALALLAALPSHATGRAEVRYIDAPRFTDAGFGPLERERTERQLTAAFERLAQRLPDGQVLRVDVTDVDLAGEIDWFSFDRVRVLGDVPDAPRLNLRYELLAGDRVLSSGEERLTDPGYLWRQTGLRTDQPLPYEQRLLDTWFRDRFAEHLAAAGRR